MFTNADLIASKQPTFEDSLISRYINEMVKVIINQGLQVKYKFCGINLKYKKKSLKTKQMTLLFMYGNDGKEFFLGMK